MKRPMCTLSVLANQADRWESSTMRYLGDVRNLSRRSLSDVQQNFSNDTCAVEMGIEPNNEGSGSVRVRLMSGSEFPIHKCISQFWVWFGHK